MNRLKVNQQETIVTLWNRGWSARRIARELGFDRDTANKYIRLEEAKSATPSPGNDPGPDISGAVQRPDGEAKPATLTAGSDGRNEAKPATPPPGRSEGADPFDQALAAARANVSLCERWQKEIEAGLDQGLTAKRIHQDLVREHSFAGSYQSVKRFVRRLEKEAAVPFRRMEFAPAEQMQVDFGTGAWIVDEH
jgi:hypothetical protein